MQRLEKKANGDYEEYEQYFCCGMRGTAPQYIRFECVLRSQLVTRLGVKLSVNRQANCLLVLRELTFRCRIKSRLPFAGISRSSPYSTRFQDKV